MPGFNIDQLPGLSSAKVFCPLTGGMPTVTSANIGSDAGIERIVGTENDIYAPIHDALNSGAEQRTDRPRESHSQSSPKGDAKSALYDSGSAGISRNHP